MPETAQQQQQQQRERPDLAKELFIDMVKTMATLSSSIHGLFQKVEDLTTALDDHRETMDTLHEEVADLSGYAGAMLNLLDDASSISEEEDRDVTWSDVHDIFRKMKKEMEKESEEEEESEGS